MEGPMDDDTDDTPVRLSAPDDEAGASDRAWEDFDAVLEFIGAPDGSGV